MKLIENFIPNNSISKKILMIIFLISSVATVIISSVQLIYDYNQEFESLDKSIDLIKKNYSHRITESLWGLDDLQLKSQINEILNIPGVYSVEVINNNKIIERAGSTLNARTIKRSLSIRYDNGRAKPTSLGELIIYINVDQILERLYKKTFFIFISQLIKTLLVSFLIYLSIQHLLTKHIVHISDYLSKLNFDLLDKELRLDRKYPNEYSDCDELEKLVFSINKMRETINKSYSELSLLNYDLEKNVELKTKQVIDQRLRLEYSAKMATLGEMAGGIAHEINNPITIISATVRVLRKKVERGLSNPEKLYTHFDTIDNTIVRISKIITGLRVVSREGYNDEAKPIMLVDIFNDVLALSTEKFKNKNIELRINLQHDIYQTILNGNRVQLSQVFLNLLGNAYDAIENTPNSWVQIDSALENEELTIRFIDSGLGIPKEMQEKILMPFFTTKEIGKGTGLGLSISTSIIKAHSGEFVIDDNIKNKI